MRFLPQWHESVRFVQNVSLTQGAHDLVGMIKCDYKIKTSAT